MTSTTMPATGTGSARAAALAGLLLAEAMNLLDSTITTVAAPVIRADLGGSTSDTQWVVAAYTLPFAVCLILGGRLGDIFGRRRLFVLGMVGFLATSALCAVAPAMAALLAARAVQGVCAALIIPQTIGLIKAIFTGPALPKALSFIGPVMGLTAVAGPILGGFLTQVDIAGLSWRAVFVVNLPLGLLVLATTRLLREDRAARRPGLDLPGFALSAVAGAAFVVPTIDGAGQGWPMWTWCSFAAGVAAVLVLVRHVRRTRRDPIVERGLFGDRGFPAALASSVLYFAAATGVVFAAVLYLQDGLGRDVLDASLTVLPFAAGLAVASLLAGQWLVPRLGNRLMLAGVAVLAVGLVAAVAAAATSAPGTVAPLLPAALGVAGLGGGLVTVPFFTAALSRVRPQETGSAAGLLNSVQQLGGTLGVAVLGSVYLTASPVPRFAFAATLAVTVGLVLVLAVSATTMLREK